MRHCLDCASDNSCQLCRVLLAYNADAIWFEAVCTFKERARAGDSLKLFVKWCLTESYLMKKY